MLAIGGAAGAASFTHVHNVAARHGQPGWLAWADAIVLELMSIASGLELRRRRREHASTTFPAVVLVFAVALSLAAQVVEAEPSPIGWTAAAIPALGFLVMVKVALGHAAGPAEWPDDAAIHATPGSRPDAEPAASHMANDTGAGADRSAPVRGPSTDRDDVRNLLPAARTVRDRLAASAEPLTRRARSPPAHRRAQRLELQGLRTAASPQVGARTATASRRPRPAAHRPTSPA